MHNMSSINYVHNELVVKYGGKSVIFDDKGIVFADKSFEEVNQVMNQKKSIKNCSMDLINEREAKFYNH